jgi:peptidoglycan/LPS O-acetylase OafA/YrhL
MENHLSSRRESVAEGSRGQARNFLFGTRSLQDTIDGHQNNYTLLRFFLAASVIYFHTFSLIKGPNPFDPVGAALAPITTVGGLAVQIFFFLSGLFVAQSYAKNPNVIHFLIKRFFRIWPGLFVCLVTTAVIACASTDPGKILDFLRFSEFYEYIVRNSVFDLTWNISGVFEGRTWTALNGSIHTLPLEIKMYAILAVCAVVGMLSGLKRMAAAAVFVLILTAIPVGHVQALDSLFNADYARAAVAMFFVGVLAFAGSRWIFIRAWQGVLIALAVLLTQGTLHVVAFYLAVVWLTLYVGQLDALGKILRPRSDLSYGVYIYGWPCQQFVVSAMGSITNPYLFAAISIMAASACAAISWRFIEKPSIKLGHRLAGMNFSALGNVPRRLLPTSYEIRLGCVLGGVLVACVSMLWITQSYNLVPVVSMPVSIVDFGPKESEAGLAINKQPNGDSALWLKFSAKPEEGTAVIFDGRRLATQLGSDGATATVDASLLAHAGDEPIFLERRFAGLTQRSNKVTLHITPQPSLAARG